MHKSRKFRSSEKKEEAYICGPNTLSVCLWEISDIQASYGNGSAEVVEGCLEIVVGLWVVPAMCALTYKPDSARYRGKGDAIRLQF